MPGAVAKGPGVARQRESTGKALSTHRTCATELELLCLSWGSHLQSQPGRMRCACLQGDKMQMASFSLSRSSFPDPPPPTLAAPSGWLLPPPEPPERSVGLPAIVTDDEKGAQPAPPQRGPHLSAPCPHPRRPQLLVGEGGRGGGGRAQHLCAERGRPARGRAAAPHPRARRKERGWRQD